MLALAQSQETGRAVDHTLVDVLTTAPVRPRLSGRPAYGGKLAQAADRRRTQSR